MFVCVWNCLIFYLVEYSSVWSEICRVLSKIQSRFLCEILGKNYSMRTFQKFCANQDQNLWNFALLSAILFWIRIALKKLTQVLSYVVCSQVRRHVHKQITKRRYEKEKLRPFVFGKPILFTLGLGLTTPYSLGILVWNFYQKFVIASIQFWLRSKTQIRPIRFKIIFLFITAWAERKVRLCETVWFFLGWILIRWTWILSRFVLNSVKILTWNYNKKTIMGEFFRNFVQTKAILYRNLWNSSLISAISFWVRIALKKIHTITFVCCLHPGKEARP